MTGPDLLRADTIFAQFARAGARIAAITAKDKLRRQLGKGLDISRGNICFSSEHVERCTRAEHGIENVLEFVGMPKPDMYSMELSLFVLEAGVRILERDRPDILYLSLTDWVQHKYAPANRRRSSSIARSTNASGDWLIWTPSLHSPPITA
jgi:phosphonoacetate hydrolase